MIKMRMQGACRMLWSQFGLGLLMLAALSLTLPVLAEVNEPDFIARCDGCQSQDQYALAAYAAVPHLVLGAPGAWSAYIGNSITGQVEAFVVEVAQGEDGFHLPMHQERVSGGYSHGAYVTVYPAEGNAQAKRDLLQAISIIDDFEARLQSHAFDGDDFGLGSAMDVMGPVDSPAGFNQVILKQGVSDAMDTWWRNSLAGVEDGVQRAASMLVDSSPYQQQLITIHFSDGTLIALRIDGRGITDGGLLTEFAVLLDTARFPDGTPIPSSGG